MKNSLFGLIATVLFSFSGFAQEKNTQESKIISESAIMTITDGDSKTDYKFNSIKEFEEYSDKIIESHANRTDADSGSGGDACSITISMSVTVTVSGSVGVFGGDISTTVSGSITVSCAEAVAAGKKLRAQLIAMAGG
jgi:hypothetical protein